MLTFAICDDDYKIRARLYKFINNFCADNNIVSYSVKQFKSGNELLNSNANSDVIFLDIFMTGLNGIRAAEKLRKDGYKGYIIFVTISKDMVFKSFAANPFDYLLKPIDEKVFNSAMSRLIKILNEHKDSNLIVKKGSDIRIINFDEILYLEVINRRIYIHLTNGSVIDYYNKIKSVESNLDKRFFRNHRSYIVNLSYVNSYNKNSITLINGELLPLSLSKSKDFALYLLNFIKGGGNDDF